MQHYSILTILPSNAHAILNLPLDCIEYMINNTNLINGIVGPLINVDDIEMGATYYLYCNISNQKYDINIILTNLINKEINNYFVNGQAYVIKKYENNYTNITKNEIDTIFNILNNTNGIIIKIKSIETINTEINDCDNTNNNFVADKFLKLFCLFNPL